ncbi:MAG TPA: 4Fe-4S dicluster domain-containing protein [Polyangiaceae bacterium]|nr:4Fe-4S dicluster domain-containing protein [Polyangiaceae bacterium]
MNRALTRRGLLAGGGVAALASVAAAAAPGVGGALLAPAPSRRWALVVDLARCARDRGCSACEQACHTTHAVASPADPRHELKWIWKEPYAAVFPEQLHARVPPARRQLPVVVTCNHCSAPPCTRVCPTGATWQRDDGVVAMDPHRCIGCRYCMAACPYDARSFNWERPAPSARGGTFPPRSLGVVEKCTLCAERLDVGLAPACVEACQRDGAGALMFGDLADDGAAVSRLLAARPALRRRPELGTQPNVYYLV